MTTPNPTPVLATLILALVPASALVIRHDTPTLDYENYGKGILFTNPAAALGSADPITDPQLRDAVIRRLKRNLQQHDLPTDRLIE